MNGAQMGAQMENIYGQIYPVYHHCMMLRTGVPIEHAFVQNSQQSFMTKDYAARLKNRYQSSSSGHHRRTIGLNIPNISWTEMNKRNNDKSAHNIDYRISALQKKKEKKRFHL